MNLATNIYHSRNTACALLSDHGYLLIQTFFPSAAIVLLGICSDLFRNMCLLGYADNQWTDSVHVLLRISKERQSSTLCSDDCNSSGNLRRCECPC